MLWPENRQHRQRNATQSVALKRTGRAPCDRSKDHLRSVGLVFPSREVREKRPQVAPIERPNPCRFKLRFRRSYSFSSASPGPIRLSDYGHRHSEFEQSRPAWKCQSKPGATKTIWHGYCVLKRCRELCCRRSRDGPDPPRPAARDPLAGAPTRSHGRGAADREPRGGRRHIDLQRPLRRRHPAIAVLPARAAGAGFLGRQYRRVCAVVRRQLRGLRAAVHGLRKHRGLSVRRLFDARRRFPHESDRSNGDLGFLRCPRRPTDRGAHIHRRGLIGFVGTNRRVGLWILADAVRRKAGPRDDGRHQRSELSGGRSHAAGVRVPDRHRYLGRLTIPRTRAGSKPRRGPGR